MSEATRTSIIGALVACGRPLTAPQVVRLMATLGISATNVRSHLTRLISDGVLVRRGARRRQVYWPSETRQLIVGGIHARLGRANERWNGRWLILSLTLPANRDARAALRAQLEFDGFRAHSMATFLRPAWPRRWARERALGYVERGSGVCVEGSPLVPIDRATINTMYHLGALDRTARRLRKQITRLRHEHLPERAFALRLSIGARVASFIGHDPNLPPELWGVRRALHALVKEYRAFDAQMRTRAQPFVAEVLDGESSRAASS